MMKMTSVWRQVTDVADGVAWIVGTCCFYAARWSAVLGLLTGGILTWALLSALLSAGVTGPALSKILLLVLALVLVAILPVFASMMTRDR